MKKLKSYFKGTKLTLTLKVFILLFTISWVKQSHSQKRMYNWYFGTNISFEWNCDNTYSFSDNINPFNSFSGPCSVSDEEGIFQFAVNATDWQTVGQETIGGIYDNTGNLMQVSSGGVADLYDNQTGSSGNAIAFHVGNNIWYAFYSYSLTVQSADYYYSIIDMNLIGNGTVGSPAGEVIEHRTFLQNSSKFHFTAARHDNGTDYWLIVAETNQINAYQVSLNGISNPVTSTMSIIPSGNNLYKVAQMSFSPDGSKLAYQWGVIDFDITNGTFSNLQHLPSSGLNCFSGNCQYLYRGKKDWLTGENYIVRYETNNLNSNSNPLDTVGFHGPASDTYAYAPDWNSNAVLHSDGNIYFKNGIYGDLSIIHNPNSSNPTIAINEVMFSGNGSWWAPVGEAGSWGFGGLPNFVTSWAVEVTAETIDQQELFSDCDSTVFEFEGTHCGLVTTEEWLFGDGSSYIGPNPTHTYLSSGTFDVSYIVKNDSTCSKWNTDTLTMTITVQNAGESNPTIIDSSLFLCSTGPTYDLTATPNSGAWSGIGITSSSEGIFDPQISGPGSFEIIFETTGSCAGDDTISIEVEAPQDASFDYATHSWCPGSINPVPIVTGLAGGTFSSNSGTLMVNPTTGEIDLANSSSGEYFVYYTTTGSCPGTDSVMVMIEEIPTAQVPDFENCEGEIYSIDFGPNSAFFNWNNITNINIGFGFSGTGNIPNYEAILPSNFSGPVKIEVVPYTSSGCSGDSIYFDITVNPEPDVSFEADILEGCSPLEVVFTNTSPNSFPGEWSFGDGNYSNSTFEASNEYLTGIYDVTLTLTNDYGCSATAIYNSYISVNEVPEVNFGYAPDIITIEDTEVYFTNYSVDAASYLWEFGDNSSSNETNPNHIYPATPNLYTVTLIGYNDDMSCSDSISKTIEILDMLTYYVPNTFTPDGNSFNQEFKPIFNSRIDENSYHLMIFNRYGEILFESYNSEFGWNGTYQNGEIVQDGVYVWKINFKEDLTDRKQEITGHVTVLR